MKLQVTVLSLAIGSIAIAQDFELEQQEAISSQVEDSNSVIEASTPDEPVQNELENDTVELSEVPPLSFATEEGTETTDEDRESSVTNHDTDLGDEIEENETEYPAKQNDQAVIVKIEIKKQVSVSDSNKSSIRLLSPWAPKPLQNPPYGWRYVPAHQTQAYQVDINTKSGHSIPLDVIPYILVPEESKDVIQIKEPGYQPDLGYQQKTSISAQLKTTNRHLGTAASSIEQSILELSELVETLPK